MSEQAIQSFEQLLTPHECELLDALNSPVRIQAFLDDVPYSAENANRSPLRVLRERSAHCLDGGLFAAALLRWNGYPPFIVDLLPAPGTDDDHVLAIFQINGRYGAVAKSNFTGLRFREPVYRTLRELVMSYFFAFFNVDGQKTLRAYTRPLDLRHFDQVGWLTSDEGADVIEKKLYHLHRISLIDEKTAAQLSPVDPISYQAGMLIANPAGLYQPHRDPAK
jgi:hypothetical protein